MPKKENDSFPLNESSRIVVETGAFDKPTHLHNTICNVEAEDLKKNRYHTPRLCWQYIILIDCLQLSRLYSRFSRHRKMSETG